MNKKAKMDMAVLKIKLRSLPSGVPHSLFIGLTDRCDLACGHCKYAGTALKKDMPPAVLRRLLSEAAGAGIPRAVLFGGEPLLYRGLEKAVRAASESGLFTELDTNGQSLDAARAADLASAGLSAVMISLHSAEPARHDALSGPGAFARAVAAARAALKAGLIVYISSCVFSRTLSGGGLARLLEFSRKIGAHGARLLPYSPPSGTGRIAARRPASTSPARLASELEKAGLDVYAGTCGVPGKASCAATRGEVLFVGPDGTVKNCPYSAGVLGLVSSGLSGFFRSGRAKNRRYFPCQKC